MYHVFETKSKPGMGIASISVDGANSTPNTTNTPGNNPTSKNSPRNSANHQRSNSNTASTPLPPHKQPTQPPATPAKPANTMKNNPTPSPSHAANPRQSVSLNAPNRNQHVQEDKTEVNLQINNNKKQQAPPPVQVSFYFLFALSPIVPLFLLSPTSLIYFYEFICSLGSCRSGPLCKMPPTTGGRGNRGPRKTIPPKMLRVSQMWKGSESQIRSRW
jgi:hypothetical protein